MKPIRLFSNLFLLFLFSQLYANSATEYAKAYDYLNSRGEVYFAFYPVSEEDLRALVNIVSVDELVGYQKVIAYANKTEFEKFLQFNLNYEVLTPPSLQGDPPPMSDYKDYLEGRVKQTNWYKYPTYSAYVAIVQKFAADYPKLCKMWDLGPSGMNNHRIFLLKISDNVDVTETEPKYLETNAIHGDETLNWMNCMHMMDTLLTTYGKDTRLTKMVNELELFFIPCINPDGTYKGGDNTVSGAIRANVADGFDLNRNYACSCGQGAPGQSHQYGLYAKHSNETKAVMNAHAMHLFNYAEDQHGGTETILYPYGGKNVAPCDEDWFLWFVKKLLAQIHTDCSNNGYMTSGPNQGWGRIFRDLYECHGIRADYNTFWGRGKSITIESSVTKNLSESQLQTHWKYLKEALIQSYEILFTGIQGIVRDSITKTPIYKVKVAANGDFDNAEVFTDSGGLYVRYVSKGTKTLTFSCTNYKTKTISNFVVDDYTKKYPLDVELVSTITDIAQGAVFIKSESKITSYGKGIKIYSGNLDKTTKVGIYDMKGALIKSMLVPTGSSVVWEGTDNNGGAISKGCYIIKIKNSKEAIAKSFVLNN